MEEQLSLLLEPLVIEAEAPKARYEPVIRAMIGTNPNMPDWIYMKAIELSRAADEAAAHGVSDEFATFGLIFQVLGLDRRVRNLESQLMTQDQNTRSLERTIRTILKNLQG